MSTVREEASSSLDELEQHVQRLEREWKEAKETLETQRKAFKQLPEDDEEGFDTIRCECNYVLEGDDERTF